MSKFYTIFTQVGAAKLANATALGTHVELTAMAVGDGNGKLPTPSEKQTALVHEVRRAPLNSIRIDDKNPSWIICEQVIPESIGGWTIREIGLFDKDNDLIAVGNFPETYKPVVSENSGRTQTIRVVLEVSSTETMELKIDPSVVLATREYVDNQIKKAAPKQLSATTKDVVDETGHTHALDMASEADAKAGKGNGIVSASQVASMFSQYGLWTYCQQYFHDLNKLVTNGQYQYNADKGSSNGPEKYGLIQVLSSHNYTSFSGWLHQTFYATSGNVYRRWLDYPDKWTEWRVLFDSSNFPIAERGGNALEVHQDYQDGSGFLYYHTPSKFPADSYEIIQSLRGNYGFQLLSANADQNKLYWRGLYNRSWGQINTIWHSGNQGSGSGLDADKLDGQEGQHYLTYAEQQANSALASAKSYAVQQDNIMQKQAQKLADTAQENAQKTASSALAGHVSAKNPHSQYLLTDNLLSQLKQYFSGGTGYQYINGRLFQWGTCKGISKHAFPIAFPNQCEVVFVTNTTRQGGVVDNAFGYPVDKTQFYAATKRSDTNGLSGYPMAFLAIGN